MKPALTLPRLLLLLLFLGAQPVEAACSQCGLLWQVESGDIPASFLFGTIHSEDPRVLDLPADVRTVFDASSTFVMELLPDFAAISAMTESMYFRDQRNLKQVLGEALFQRAVKALDARGIGAGVAIKLKPWAAAVTLSFPESETGLFLDLLLYRRALRQGKETVGIEAAREQLGFFTGMAMPNQIALLRATLDHLELTESGSEALISAWLARDVETLTAINEAYLQRLPDDLADRFRTQAIMERNARMARRLTPILAEGDAFIAVGALHLYGAEGLIQLLRDSGYEVKCVY